MCALRRKNLLIDKRVDSATIITCVMKLACLVLLLSVPLLAAHPILIVSDGAPTRILAVQLKGQGIESETVTDDTMPAKLSAYPAVLLFLHKVLKAETVKASIDYANAGGKLIVLHHSISSQKRQNPDWLKFLGISLPEGDVAQGGYKYYEGITLTIVNLGPKEWITTHGVHWDARAEYKGEDRDSFDLPDTEVYLNHVLDGPHTMLLGLKFHDQKSGKTYEQDSAGWYKKAGKGWVMYFMAGHTGREFENPAYAQILTNAVNFKR